MEDLALKVAIAIFSDAAKLAGEDNWTWDQAWTRIEMEDSKMLGITVHMAERAIEVIRAELLETLK